MTDETDDQEMREMVRSAEVFAAPLRESAGEFPPALTTLTCAEPARLIAT